MMYYIFLVDVTAKLRHHLHCTLIARQYRAVDDQLIYSLISYLQRRNISLKKT